MAPLTSSLTTLALCSIMGCLICAAVSPLGHRQGDLDLDLEYVSQLLEDEDESGLEKRGPSLSLNQEMRHFRDILRQQDRDSVTSDLHRVGKRQPMTSSGFSDDLMSINSPAKRHNPLMVDLSTWTLVDSLSRGRQKDALTQLMRKGKRSIKDDLFRAEDS